MSSLTAEDIAFAAADLTSHVYNVSQRPVRHGGLSDIYSGYCAINGRRAMVALKVHRIAGPATEKIKRRITREISVWKSVDHPFTQPLLGLYLGIVELPAMVSPWCNNGDINAYLRSRSQDITEQKLESLSLTLLVEVLCGLDYLHNRNIVHADIKGANVLISDEGTARLSDFGFSSVVAEYSSMLPHETSVKGTFRWMAPELFAEDGARHTTESDTWATGCLFLEVLSGQPPYHTKSSDLGVIIAISKNELPTRHPQVPESVWRVVKACCAVQATERPAIQHVLQRMRLIRMVSSSKAEGEPSDSYKPDEEDMDALVVSLNCRSVAKEFLDGDEIQALDAAVAAIPARIEDTGLSLILRHCIEDAAKRDQLGDNTVLVRTAMSAMIALQHHVDRERYTAQELRPLQNLLRQVYHVRPKWLFEAFLPTP
ncbi:kinase-like protein [Exidia glandulosa HHB12029]|uniref:non-specific serine/threonine protein kinase n=1 Tax=Exidia glandulosa HHB12029 TaxID=1314781 RepID=A0A165LTI1_EXIGL|nr:kinase-like protein [Exidia glandulosa HHB12029]